MPYAQLDWHVDAGSWPEWGSAPRGPVISLDMAHAGELLDSVIGPDLATGGQRVYHILRCEICISTHAWPLPSQDALDRYYQKQFYQQEKPDYLERYERDRAWWETCVYRPILRQCCAIFGTETLQGKRFLDIGAGPGIALDVAGEMGAWTAFVEPSLSLTARLGDRGHVSLGNSLENMTQTQTADIVLLYEVLEHQPCPEDFLLRCYDLLRPGGLLIVTVPNDYNPLQLEACRQFGLPRWWLAPIQHLHYFTPKMLQLLIRRCGYTMKDMRGTYPLETHILGGQNYIGNDTVGRGIHMTRIAIEQKAVAQGSWGDLEAAYREGLAAARIGREIVCIAQKR